MFFIAWLAHLICRCYNRKNGQKEGLSVTNADLHYKKMTETPVAALILRLGIPTTISMLITSIYNMADTYFVGTLGESAQAATGVLFTLQTLIQGVAFMLGQGSGSFISRELADRNVGKASTYISSAFFIGAVFGITILLVGMPLLAPMARILGSTETILPHAMDYGMWVLIGCPFVVCSMILNNALRFEGKAFYAMFGITTGGILNIFGDWLLVIRLGMGVFGAGMATAVSQFISFSILLFMFRKMAQSKLSVHCISRDFRLYISVFRVGLPSLIRQSLNAVTSGVLNNLTKAFGDAAIAAMSVVSRYAMFLMCVGLGMGQGFQPVASFNYRAAKYDRVKKGLVFLVVFALVVIGGASTTSIFLAPEIIQIFQNAPDVVAVGATALRNYAFGMIFMSFSVPVNMLYQSIQKPTISSVLSMIRSGAVTIPILLIGVPLLGLPVIQTAQPIADVLAGCISIPFILDFLRKDHNK